MTRSSALPALLLAAVLPIAALPDAARAGETHGAPHAAAHDDDHGGDGDGHLAEKFGLRAVHAWTPEPAGDGLLVYVDLENTGADEIALLGGAAEIAGSVTLVGFALKDGAPAYEPLPAVPIRPGRELVLAPNGLALRLDGLTADLHEGDSFDMRLLTSAGEIAVEVAVEAKNARQHSHAGHAH